MNVESKKVLRACPEVLSSITRTPLGIGQGLIYKLPQCNVRSFNKMMDEEKEGAYRPRRTTAAAKRKPKRPHSKAVEAKRNRLFLSRGLRAPIPYKLKTAMLYQERVTLAPALGVAAVHVFSANGTYDPNITGVGHQPRGFDQMMALYDHNVVVGCDIRVDFPGVGEGGNKNPGIAWVALRDFTTVGVTERDYLEIGDCTWESTSPLQGYPTRLMMTCNPNKYLGRSSPLSDPNLKNSSGSNPSEQAYWHVGLGQASGLEITSLPVNVTIKYTVIFIEPKDPGQS